MDGKRPNKYDSTFERMKRIERYTSTRSRNLAAEQEFSTNLRSEAAAPIVIHSPPPHVQLSKAVHLPCTQSHEPSSLSSHHSISHQEEFLPPPSVHSDCSRRSNHSVHSHQHSVHSQVPSQSRPTFDQLRHSNHATVHHEQYASPAPSRFSQTSEHHYYAQPHEVPMPHNEYGLPHPHTQHHPMGGFKAMNPNMHGDISNIPRAGISSIAIPRFNGSADNWPLFLTSLRSYFISTGVNLYLLSPISVPCSVQENLFLWSTLEQAIRGTSLSRFSTSFMDNGRSLFLFLHKRFE
jgi:hypothetical protein